MAKFVFQSVRKITHANWLLNGRMFHDIGRLQYALNSEPISFNGKIFYSVTDFNEAKGELVKNYDENPE